MPQTNSKRAAFSSFSRIAPRQGHACIEKAAPSVSVVVIDNWMETRVYFMALSLRTPRERAPVPPQG